MNERNRGRLFFRSLAPVLFAIFLQNAISIFLMEVFFVYRAFRFTGGSYSDLMQGVTDSLLGPDMMAWISVLYSLTGVIIFGIWFKRSIKNGTATHLSMKGYSPLLAGGVVLFAFGGQIFCNYIANVIGKLFPTWLTEYLDLMKRAGLDGSQIGPVMILYAFILGPICEELIFRGLTFSKLRLAFSFWTANVLQALLFAGFHMNKLQAVYVFVMGLALGYVAEKTGNIYITIILHILYNSSSIIVTALLQMVPEMPVLTFALILGSMLLFYAGIMLTIDAAPDYDDEKNEPAQG